MNDVASTRAYNNFPAASSPLAVTAVPEAGAAALAVAGWLVGRRSGSGRA